MSYNSMQINSYTPPYSIVYVVNNFQDGYQQFMPSTYRPATLLFLLSLTLDWPCNGISPINLVKWRYRTSEFRLWETLKILPFWDPSSLYKKFKVNYWVMRDHIEMERRGNREERKERGREREEPSQSQTKLPVFLGHTMKNHRAKPRQTKELWEILKHYCLSH